MAEEGNLHISTRPTSPLANMGCTIFTCCVRQNHAANKVLPHMILSDVNDFLETQPGRRLRILNYKPSHKLPPPFQPVLDTPTVLTTKLDDSDSSEEEYWFENAAPKRIPVIQPQPTQVTQSRIINKFEPQQTTSPGQPRSLEEDTISPGRLPRKNLGGQGVVDDIDDYEDEDLVETVLSSSEISSEKTDGLKGSLSSLSEPISNGIGVTSGLILEITADSTKDMRKSPSVIRRNISSPSASPLPGREDIDSPLPSSPPLPILRPSSPEHLADDSCHPSPEIPHRSVSIVPDPRTERLFDIPGPILIIEGGNLGGVANPGFEDDEEDTDDSDDFYSDNNSSVTIEATNESVTFESVDAAYHRSRDLDSFIQETNHSQEGGQISETTEEVTRHIPAAVNLPILFFLHGVGGSADSWRNQLEYFHSHGYQVIAPDLLGHGFSSCPDKAKAYTFSKLFKDILAIFDTYVPEDKKSIVFGHSYGCSFTIALARTRPERISTLIMVASGGPTPLAPPPHIKRSPECLIDCAKRILECKWKAEQRQKYNPRGKTLKFNRALDVPGYVFKHILAGQIWPEGDPGFHRRVTIPTLLVYGMRDTLVSLVEECEMERTLPKAYLELIPTAGHSVMSEAPHQLNTMAHKFINKWNSNNASSQSINR